MNNKYIMGALGFGLAMAGSYGIGRLNGGPDTGIKECGAVAHIESSKHNDMADLVGRAATAAGIDLRLAQPSRITADASLTYRIGTAGQEPDSLSKNVGMQLCVNIDPATNKPNGDIPGFNFVPQLPHLTYGVKK